MDVNLWIAMLMLMLSSGRRVLRPPDQQPLTIGTEIVGVGVWIVDFQYRKKKQTTMA
jgi:hypothetical protein